MRYWSRSMAHPPSRVRQVVRESSPLASAFADQIPFQALLEAEEISPTEKNILDRLEQITSTPEIVPTDETPGGIGSLDSIARLLGETAVTVDELERTRIDDHGNLTGLTDDDHSQYHTNTRGDARYYTKTQLMISGILDWENWGRYLGTGNTKVFTPDQDYEPATKKYVDDNAGETDHGVLEGLADDDHPQYIKDSEFTAADEVIVGTGAGTFGQVTLAASQFLAKRAAGVATNVTAAEARTILNVEDDANNYSHPNHTGDVTSVGDGTTTIAVDAVETAMIRANQVTDNKLANMVQARIKGRASGVGTGDPTDLTATQVRTVLNVADGAIANLIEDTTPQLGGSLDVNGHSIVSAGGGSIAITPDGAGLLTLDGLRWPEAPGAFTAFLYFHTTGNRCLWGVLNDFAADATPDGAADYVMSYDASAGYHKKVLVDTLVGASAPKAHKDSHDPEDGSDKLDCAAAGDIGTSNTEGTAHSFARSDHQHKIPDKWRTETFHIVIPSPVVGEEHIVKTFKHESTMQEVRDVCKAATSATYSLYTRARATPWTAAGQSTIVNGAVATTTENAAAIASATLAANTQLICKITAVSDVPEAVVVSGGFTRN